jgi:hypothetical protein
MSLVDDLVSTYRAPSPKMVDQMVGIVKKIPERYHAEIFQAILEEEGPNIQIGVSHIVAACERIGAPYTKAHYIPTEDWTCDACGYEFKYHPAPSDDDKIDKNIHDLCPMCGMQVYWTMTAEKLNVLFGKLPMWYIKVRDECRESFGPKVASHVTHKGPTGAGLNLFRGGIFWARSHAENERREERRLKVDAKMGEIDRAKRWDLGDGE